ncbi:MAG: hypothetical protein V3W41_13885 [Planctomycetota bacterium]
MNTALFKSPHAIYALLICIGFGVWPQLIGARIGPVTGGDVNYLLWSGWIAFALMVVACLYVLRKYIHKLGWSPELRMKMPVAVLERTDSRLNDVRRRIAQGSLTDLKEVKTLTANILRDEGVQKVIVCDVEEGDTSRGEPSLKVMARPTEPYGRMVSWLHAHAYYGIASGVLVWLHGGMKFDEPMGIALNVLTLVVIVTGIVGLFLFAMGPSWIAKAEQDISFEQQYVLTHSLEEKFNEAMTKFEDEPELAAQIRKAQKAGGNFDDVAKRELATAVAAKPDAKVLLQDVMVLLGQRRRIEKGLAGLMRIRFLMNFWRVVHVPLSIVLMVVVFVHIVQVWWY